MEALVDVALLAFLAVVAFAIVRLHSLFAVVMLGGIYSLLSAALFVALDAVDVAFTEAAVGAGVSTVLLLATLGIVGSRPRPPPRRPLLPLAVVVVTGVALLYGTVHMPPFGAADNPVHQHVAPHYLEQTASEVGIPNVVTAVLASYRSYDTLGEVTVVFTAGVGVLALLGIGRRRGRGAP